MFAMIILGLVPPLTQNAVYQWVYQATVYPLTMAIFSSLAFYITSAAYRAFRAHNLDATVFLMEEYLNSFYFFLYVLLS
jgi:hypothetical protein